ncbi:hypothetical protein ACFLXF_01455 [Chloroflexota bacterium]
MSSLLAGNQIEDKEVSLPKAPEVKPKKIAIAAKKAISAKKKEKVSK